MNEGVQFFARHALSSVTYNRASNVIMKRKYLRPVVAMPSYLSGDYVDGTTTGFTIRTPSIKTSMVAVPVSGSVVVVVVVDKRLVFPGNGR